MKTGVLALQGSFYDHVQSLEFIDQDYVLIKDTSDLSHVNSLILPGGELSLIHISEPTRPY